MQGDGEDQCIIFRDQGSTDPLGALALYPNISKIDPFDVETHLYDLNDVVMTLYYVQASLFDVEMFSYGLHASFYDVVMPLY